VKAIIGQNLTPGQKKWKRKKVGIKPAFFLFPNQ